jgi:hypothetical protein
MSGLLADMRSQAINANDSIDHSSISDKLPEASSVASCVHEINAMFLARPNATRIALSRLGVFCLRDVNIRISNILIGYIICTSSNCFI